MRNATSRPSISHRVVQAAQHQARLGQHPVEGLLDGDRREQAGDVGFAGMVSIHAEQDKRSLTLPRAGWSTRAAPGDGFVRVTIGTSSALLADIADRMAAAGS